MDSHVDATDLLPSKSNSKVTEKEIDISAEYLEIQNEIQDFQKREVNTDENIDESNTKDQDEANNHIKRCRFFSA